MYIYMYLPCVDLNNQLWKTDLLIRVIKAKWYTYQLFTFFVLLPLLPTKHYLANKVYPKTSWVIINNYTGWLKLYLDNSVVCLVIRNFFGTNISKDCWPLLHKRHIKLKEFQSLEHDVWTWTAKSPNSVATLSTICVDQVTNHMGQVSQTSQKTVTICTCRRARFWQIGAHHHIDVYKDIN